MAIAFRMIFIAILAVAPITAMNPRKLDETTPASTNPVGSPDDDQIKCGSCPCGKTCYSSPPPPPPPSPPPPKKPSPTPGVNCPPPPSGGGGGGGGGGGKAPPDYIYITGPPGDLYPVVQNVSGGGRRSFTVAPPLLILLLGMLGFW